MIVLSGGLSTRLGQDKGLLMLGNKPLIKHVLDATSGITDERIVVVSSPAQAEDYAKRLDPRIRILVDACKAHGPLAGVLTGFNEANGTYSLLLPCDTPLVSSKVLALFIELCMGKSAVIPRWPNGYIEPLQAVYCTRKALAAAEDALAKGESRLQGMIDRLQGIRYVSTLVLQQIDPRLTTFFNINTSSDLKQAESLLKKAGEERTIRSY